MEKTRNTLHVALALFALGAITSHCTACSPAVAQYERLLDGCLAAGKAAKSYDVYEACANRVDAELCRENGIRCQKDGGTQ